MKNYRDIFESGNDDAAVEQNIYLAREGKRGVFTDPTERDFIYHLPGGGISVEQPIESSLQRSGRHHRSPRKRKQSVTWSLKTNMHVAADGDIDQPLVTLLISAIGHYDQATKVFDTSKAPDLTFTMIECGGSWSKQAVGSFVMEGTFPLPSDGEPVLEFSGNSKECLLVGIVKSQLDNAGTEGSPVKFNLDPDQSLSQMPVGARVMIVKADGTSRSADTATSRKVLKHVVDGQNKAVILDGTPLTADSSGSPENPVYLCYWEPENQTGIDNPLLGLEGSISVQNYEQAIKNMTVKISQNHKLENDVFGTSGLGGKLYQAVNRVTVENTLSANLNKTMLGLINDIREVNPNHVSAILGDTDEGHVSITTPRVHFNIPNYTVPDEGEIPVEMTGTCYENPGRADEFKLEIRAPAQQGSDSSFAATEDGLDKELKPKKRSNKKTTTERKES